MLRRVVIVGLVILLVGSAVTATRPWIVDRLPEPLSGIARLPEKLWTRVLPRRVRKQAGLRALTGPEREAVRTLAGRLAGQIVWSSNRSGNHELYLLDLTTQSVRQLTHHPNVDFFGRFSPNGRQIVFLRSQREGVSARDQTAWDVFLIDADGTGERRLVRGGFYPTWTADGRAVVFVRNRQVFRYDLAAQRETLVLDGPKEFPGIGELGDVELAPEGRRLAFPLRGTFAGAFGLHGPFSGAVVLDLEARGFAFLTRRQACETTWAPDGSRVVWVETGGNGGTQIMTGAPDGSGRRVLMDLPGPYSHEYFPKLSNDGRWLIWGAAAEGHEHDQADYEIFVWEIGTPVEQAVRVTHHPENDQWPDLHVR